MFADADDGVVSDLDGFARLGRTGHPERIGRLQVDVDLVVGSGDATPQALLTGD
jgi:hypothetical protein